jgi:hypothetical protein
VCDFVLDFVNATMLTNEGGPAGGGFKSGWMESNYGDPNPSFIALGKQCFVMEGSE